MRATRTELAVEVIATVDKKDCPVSVPVQAYCAPGVLCEEQLPLQREQLLDVFVNDILTMRVGCSEGSLVELVVGRLFTEGLITGIDEIDCMSVCDRSMRADVYLKNREADLSRRHIETVPTCCTMNRTLNDYFSKGETLRPVQPIAWSPDWVLDAARDFRRDTPMHRATGGSHSCRLVGEGGVLVCCEDIGRHNALDKAIGMALTRGIDLRACVAFTSGRVPTDMAVKAVRAGIPVLATCKVATDKALDLAREYGLTLVVQATCESFRILCGELPRGGLAAGAA